MGHSDWRPRRYHRSDWPLDLPTSLMISSTASMPVLALMPAPERKAWDGHMTPRVAQSFHCDRGPLCIERNPGGAASRPGAAEPMVSFHHVCSRPVCNERNPGGAASRPGAAEPWFLFITCVPDQYVTRGIPGVPPPGRGRQNPRVLLITCDPDQQVSASRRTWVGSDWTVARTEAVTLGSRRIGRDLFILKSE